MSDPLSAYGSITSIAGLGATVAQTLAQWWNERGKSKKTATLDHYTEWLRRRRHTEVLEQIERSKETTAELAKLIVKLRSASAADATLILDRLAEQSERLASMDGKLGLLGRGMDELPHRVGYALEPILSDIRDALAHGLLYPDVSKEDREYEDRYRNALAENLDEVELFGVDLSPQSSRAQKLSAAYISLNLASIDGDGEEGSQSAESVLNTLHPGQGRLLLRGEAGSGKTTLMRWAAIQASTTDDPLEGDTPGSLQLVGNAERVTGAVFAALRVLSKEGCAIPAGALRLLVLQRIWLYRIPFLLLVRECPKGNLPAIDDYPLHAAGALREERPGWARRVLEARRGLVLIDGVDETAPSNREKLKRQIKQLTAVYPDTYFIVTTRPGAVEDGWLADLGFREALINPLTGAERDLFVDRWHDAVSKARESHEKREDFTGLREKLKRELRDNPSVALLATTPLLAAMICALHRDRQQKLPEAQYDLVETLCEMILYRREREGRLDLSEFPPEYRDLSYAQRRSLLQRVAHYMVTQDVSSLERRLAVRKIGDALKSIPGRRDEDKLEVLKGLIERSGMLRGKGKDSIDFIHNTFKEYLAARQFVQDVDVGTLASRVEDAQWEQVLLFAAGTTESQDFPTKLIAQVAPSTTRADAKPARRVSNTEREKRYRRKMMAVRMRGVAQELDEKLNQRVSRLERDVFPPRTLTEAAGLAGTRGVERYLRYNPKMGVRRRMACVRALRLMGTDTARAYLNDYRDDTNWAVVEELSQAINPLEIPEVVRRLQLEWNSKQYEQEGVVRARIINLSPLAGLTGLQRLYLTGTQVSDLFPLAGLTGLQLLDLQGTPVSDLSPLAGLTGLQLLWLNNTQVSDLSPLAGLTGLQGLGLARTQVSDLSPLAGLTGLTFLHLQDTPVSDLSLLVGLTGLHELYLANTPVSDLSPLAGLAGLQTLDLQDTLVSDLSSLGALTGLQWLDLDRTPVSDLSPLAGLTGLTFLHLQDTPVSDLSLLVGLTGLHELYLANTPVSDLSPLAGLAGLQTLDLQGTLVSDLSPLAGLTGLQTLNLLNTQVTDLSPLAELTGLQRLDLDGTQVSDLSPLAGLTGLRRLDLDGTQVSDLSPLGGLTGLQTLWLRQTEVSDLSPLAGLAHVRVFIEKGRHIRIPPELEGRVERV